MSKDRVHVHVALVHWPVLDRAKNIVCTNVTNFDVHDIARACRTYGVHKYHIVNRLKEQLIFVSRLLEHWRLGWGAEYNPSRKTALGMVELHETLDDVLKSISERPIVVCTSARELGIPRVTFRELREKIQNPQTTPILLVFGTGFGLEESVLKQADLLLEPITGAAADGFRHLSVRSAVSIILDRLLGTW
ncbi:MAG: RNA methyltransferase [Bdellovibrionales bacterium]